MPLSLEDFDEDVGEKVLLEMPTGTWKVVRIDRVVPADWNYKVDDPEMEEKLRNNIKRLGQIENTHVRLLDTGNYEMINGNHRLPILEEEGYTHIVVFDHGEVSQAEAIRRAIETNETNIKPDEIALSERIAELEEFFGDLDEIRETMPFPEDRLKDLSDLSEFNWEEFEDEEMPGDEDEDGEEWVRYEVAVPAEVVPVLDEAAASIEERMAESGNDPHEDDEVRRGQVLEALSAEYLGDPASPLHE